MTVLLVPANGGSAYTTYYTAADVTAGTIGAGGALVAASGSLEIPANAPIGVVYHDWYQDVRGKWLNYRMHPDGGHVLTDWFVEVPYINNRSAGTVSGVSPRVTTGDYINTADWYDVNSKFTYLQVDQGDNFGNGVFVSPD